MVPVGNNRIRVNVFGSDSLFRSDNFKAGPLIKFDFGRDKNDSPDLTGLGNVGYSKLLSDSKISTIVAVQGSSDQFFGGLWAVYSF